MSFRVVVLFSLAASLVAEPAQSSSGINRWFSVENAAFASRFVWAQNTQGTTIASQLQHQQALQARLQLFPDKLSVVGLAAAGNHFTVGWNNAGPGLGQANGNIYVKQLYLSARPTQSVELQYGGFGIERGVSTDITSYHGQAFMTGQRLVLSKPGLVWFDRVALTYGFLGDFDKPGLNRRLHRLGDGNYRHFLVSKQLNQTVSFSADLTNLGGVKTLREAVAVRVPRVVDSVRLELYQRFGNRAAGLHAGFSRQLQRRLSLDAGYIAIDRNFGNLNNDAFFNGKRIYAGPVVQIAPGLSFFSLFHRTVATRFAVPNRQFAHVGLQYDVLKAWRESAGK